MPEEDEYWERIRERMEMGETEPEPEEKILSLDEELEELEKKYGCKLEELGEPDLEEIVYRLRGEYPAEAKYEPDWIAIFYRLDAA